MKDNQIFPARNSASTPLQSQASSPQRILIVDDDIFFRQLRTEEPIHSGYKVDAAAWQSPNTDSYDLLMTDYIMPKVTGVELRQKLRAARMALPVIVATGNLPKEEFTRNPWLRPAAALCKPFAVEEKLRTEKEVLRATDGVRSPCEIFLAAGSSASAPSISRGEQIGPPPNWQNEPSADGLRPG